MNETMFCYQCQETSNRAACLLGGACGKNTRVAALQDLLIYVTEGLSCVTQNLREQGIGIRPEVNHMISENLYLTMTGVNFDGSYLLKRIEKTLAWKEALLPKAENRKLLPEGALWIEEADSFPEKADSPECRILDPKDHNGSSVRQMALASLKGIAWMLVLVNRLGEENEDLEEFLQRGLASLMEKKGQTEELLALALETGQYAFDAAAALDEIRSFTYGSPEVSAVDVSAGKNPGILVAGSDFRILENILEAAEQKNIDVYTYGDMIFAGAYPLLRGYARYRGNYGNAWTAQKEEFESFHGPIVVSGMPLLLPGEAYRDRLWLSGENRCSGIFRILSGSEEELDALLEQAENSVPPEGLEKGRVLTGFGHDELFRYASAISEGIASGEIAHIVIFLGEDGNDSSREYYTELALALPENVLIMTAGSIKYRFNKQPLGQIAGLPRLIDTGDIAGFYSAVLFLFRLRDLLGKKSFEELPVTVEMAWYDQRDIACLMALFSLEIKDIRLGPSVPAFFSPDLWELLQQTFAVKEPQDALSEVRDILGSSAEPNVLYTMWMDAKRSAPVTGDMLVSSVLEMHPDAAEILEEVGMRCTGCAAALMESLEEACSIHGIDAGMVLERINSGIRSKKI